MIPVHSNLESDFRTCPGTKSHSPRQITLSPRECIISANLVVWLHLALHIRPRRLCNMMQLGHSKILQHINIYIPSMSHNYSLPCSNFSYLSLRSNISHPHLLRSNRSNHSLLHSNLCYPSLPQPLQLSLCWMLLYCLKFKLCFRVWISSLHSHDLCLCALVLLLVFYSLFVVLVPDPVLVEWSSLRLRLRLFTLFETFIGIFLFLPGRYYVLFLCFSLSLCLCLLLVIAVGIFPFFDPK